MLIPEYQQIEKEDKTTKRNILGFLCFRSGLKTYNLSKWGMKLLKNCSKPKQFIIFCKSQLTLLHCGFLSMRMYDQIFDTYYR